jgi:hypothetical protein
VTRRLKPILVFLLLGFVLTVAVSMILATWATVWTGGPATATRGDWIVTAQWNPGGMQVISSRTATWKNAAWNPAQATGAPDTLIAGDMSTAWAPSTSNGQGEWLLLEYDEPIAPRFVDVHESFRPGALTRVTLVKDDGEEVEAWSGEDPTSPSASIGVSHIPVQVAGGGPTPAVRLVKLYVGRSGLAGWNEIDAVAMIDAQGQTHWAVDASASSWYGQANYGLNSSSSGVPETLIPPWSGLSKPQRGPRGKSGVGEEVGVEAHGWPMLALYGYFDPHKAASAALGPMTVGSRLGYGSTAATPSGLGFSTGSYIAMPAASAGASKPVLPWRPIWPGLAADTALYAAALWLLWAVLTKPRRFFVELSRVRRGCCIACGYDLGYDFRPGCPECGWRRERATGRPARDLIASNAGAGRDSNGEE